MSFNGSGTFQINSAGQPVVSGTVISSTAFNALTADLATGLSTCITKDGQTTVTANIPMGNNKITGLAVGTAATDAANLSQVQSTAAKLINSVSGADTITGTMSPTLASYAAGQMFYWVAAGDNTGAVTLNIDSLGAKSVTRDGSVALAAGDIKSGEVVVVVYDGTRFQVVSQLNSSGDARFANVSIASALNVGGVATVTGGSVLNGGVVINEPGANADTRIEGDTDQNLVFVDASADAVGIGTASPLYKVHAVVSSGNDVFFADANAQSFGGYRIRAGAGGQQWAFRGGSSTMSLTDVTAGADRVVVDGSGNCGIGTASPAAGLHVANGNIRLTNGSAFTSSNSLIREINAAAGSSNQFVTSSIGFRTDAFVDSGIITFGTASGASTPTERMRLDASGNLSVGAVLAENSVGVYLLPSGEMRVKDSTEDGTSQISIYNTNTTADAEQFFAAMNSSDVDMGNRRSGALKLFTNNSERARITNSGDLLVGTTTYQNKRVTIDGGSSGGVWASCSDSANAVNVTYNSATSGDNVFEQFYTDGGPNLRGSITYNRGAGQVAYNITSDVRLKDNISDAADAGVKIDSLQVRQFDWKESGNHVDYGFVAQELHAVAPQAVTKPEDEESMWSVDYSKLVPILVKEIQSLRARVAALESA